MNEPTAFATGLHLAECPRWRDGALWMSDMWGRTVYRFDERGTRQTVYVFDDEPGGLGWLPDGRLLVVSMGRRAVLRFDGDHPVVHADLTAFAPWQCNDMIVNDDGIAYVGHFGWDLFGRTTRPATATLLRVLPDGAVDVVADELMFPNGIALSDDGRTLVVAEPGGSRLTRFRVEPDGTLRDRSLFAAIAPVAGAHAAPPDGICLDALGAVWMAEPIGRRVLRVEPGGRITHEVAFDAHPLAVALGGADRRTLFVCLGGQLDHDNRDPAPLASIVALRVDVPGGGRP